MTAIPLPRPEEIHYPESDGKPMGETDVHIKEIMYLIQGLRAHFEHVSDVYVAGDLLLYYKEGDPGACVVPDVMVVKGVPKGDRRTYKLWEEGHAPSAVIEVTSRSSRKTDLTTKKALYERWGVEEYFVHDPLGEYLRPRLQGFRLFDGRYQPMRPEADGSLLSRTTNLLLKPEEQSLRLIDASTGQPLPTYEEIADARRAAEEELGRLRAEIERLRSQR